jgi:hypothetical protein
MRRVIKLNYKIIILFSMVLTLSQGLFAVAVTYVLIKNGIDFSSHVFLYFFLPDFIISIIVFFFLARRIFIRPVSHALVVYIISIIIHYILSSILVPSAPLFFSSFLIQLFLSIAAILIGIWSGSRSVVKNNQQRKRSQIDSGL